MSEQISLLKAAAHPGNTEGVTPTTPTMRYRPEKCEFPVHIGVFFDGTGNNQDWAEPDLGSATQLARKKDTNVARSSRAYLVLTHGIEPFEVQRHVAALAAESGSAVRMDTRLMAKVESLRASGQWQQLMQWRAVQINERGTSE